jgi:hypothetical protein
LRRPSQGVVNENLWFTWFGLSAVALDQQRVQPRISLAMARLFVADCRQAQAELDALAGRERGAGRWEVHPADEMA